MEQYLLELIKNNNRVIIPEFGAFIISRDAGTTVLFNNFLTFNDGLVTNHLSEREGIEPEEATQRVSEFVNKIKKELDEKGEYHLENIGRFIKDQNGILRFTQDPGITNLILDTENETSNPSEVSELLDIENEPHSKIEDLSKDEPSHKTESTDSSKKGDNLLSLEDSKAATTSSQSVRSSNIIPPPPRKDSAVINDEPESKNNGRNWWIILVILFIIAAFLFIYFKYFRHRNETKEIEVPVTSNVVDTLKADNETSATPDSISLTAEEGVTQTQIEEKEEEKVDYTGPRHHIIVGSFKNANNAEQLVKKLKQKGYINAYKFERNGLFMVSAASYQSLIDARKAQEMFVEKERLENWILTLRQ